MLPELRPFSVEELSAWFGVNIDKPYLLDIKDSYNEMNYIPSKGLVELVLQMRFEAMLEEGKSVD
jgi:hypothetical protein